MGFIVESISKCSWCGLKAEKEEGKPAEANELQQDNNDKNHLSSEIYQFSELDLEAFRQNITSVQNYSYILIRISIKKK